MVIFNLAQRRASIKAVEFLNDTLSVSTELLIWAVTGAGKTEVIFETINKALILNQNILIATPRKDVVLEITPRLQQAFPTVPIIALYGESTQKGEIGQLVVATSHQTINLYRYFDLVIIDEVDAFPYHNNIMLRLAVSRAAKETGKSIYLTATPPKEILHRVRKGKADMILLPNRHHGYPLVIPQVIKNAYLRKQLYAHKLPKEIKRFVHHLIETNRQGFLFVPKIDWIHILLPLIQNISLHPSQDNWVNGTFAGDPERNEKIKSFREGVIRLMITTTILERGVTIPYTDCLVFMADSPIFDEHALVQISGRVGRSSDDPSGEVIFLCELKTMSMVKAIKQIKKMNKAAKKEGYLKPHKG